MSQPCRSYDVDVASTSYPQAGTARRVGIGSHGSCQGTQEHQEAGKPGSREDREAGRTGKPGGPGSREDREAGRTRKPGALVDGKHLERRVPGCDGTDLVVTRVRPGAFEEDADFRFPSLQVGAQDRYLLVVGELAATEAFGPAAHPQLPGSGGPQVAYPLRFAAGCDQVTMTLVAEQVHRRGPPLAARPALHRQHPPAEDADALRGQEGHHPVEDVAREPARRTVMIGHAPNLAGRVRAALPGLDPGDDDLRVDGPGGVNTQDRPGLERPAAESVIRPCRAVFIYDYDQVISGSGPDGLPWVVACHYQRKHLTGSSVRTCSGIRTSYSYPRNISVS